MLGREATVATVALTGQFLLGDKKSSLSVGSFRFLSQPIPPVNNNGTSMIYYVTASAEHLGSSTRLYNASQLTFLCVATDWFDSPTTALGLH